MQTEFVPLVKRPKFPFRNLPIEGRLWLFAALGLGIGGAIKSINLVIILAILLLALFFVNLWLAGRSLRSVQAKRLWPMAPVAGLPISWIVQVSTRKYHSLGWSLVEPLGGEECPGWLILSLEPNKPLQLAGRGIFPKRGKILVPPLEAYSGYPFGLIQTSRLVSPSDSVIVLAHPRPVNRERLLRWLRGGSGDGELRRVIRITPHEGEFHGLRDYRPGDSPRHVDWKATARQGRLAVREYEPPVPPRLLLVVEAYLPAKPTPQDRDHLEKTISLAAGIMEAWGQELGSRLVLVLAEKTCTIHETDPPRPALEALAVLEGTPECSFQQMSKQIPRAMLGAPVLVLSSALGCPGGAIVSAQLNRPVRKVSPNDDSLPWLE